MALLIGPPFPEPLSYLWEWLLELDRAREVGSNGAKLFTYPMLDAWARMTERNPAQHEVDALMRLGHLFLYPPKEKG